MGKWNKKELTRELSYLQEEYNKVIKKQYSNQKITLRIIENFYAKCRENIKNGEHACDQFFETNALLNVLEVGSTNKEVYIMLEKLIKYGRPIFDYDRPMFGYASSLKLAMVYSKASKKHTEWLIDLLEEIKSLDPSTIEYWERKGIKSRVSEKLSFIIIDKLSYNIDKDRRDFCIKEEAIKVLLFGEVKNKRETIECAKIHLNRNSEILEVRAIKKLGESGTRKVYKGIDYVSKKSCVIKLEKKIEEIKNLRAKKVFDLHPFVQVWQKEINLLQGFKHENIASILDNGNYKGRRYIIEKYYDKIDLEKLVKKTGSIKTTREFALLFSPMFEALKYLEKKGYVHRDIKPDNILVSDDLKDIVLTDLQNATRMNKNGEYLGPSFGSYRTAAPELLFENRASSLSDYYAIGNCMYFALTREMMFDEEVENKNVREKRYLEACKKLDEIKSTLIEDEISKKCNLNPSDICEMIKSLISQNENQRLKINGNEFYMAGLIEVLSRYYNKIISKED